MAFVAVGVTVAKAILHHAVVSGADPVQVRLGAWTGGLFAGGLSAVLVGIAVAWAMRPRR